MSVFMKKNRFPREKLPYVKLDYIRCTGTQYIDTGFIPNQDTRVLIDVYLDETDSIKAIFGARNSDTTGTTAFAMFQYADKLRSDYGREQLSFDITPTSGRFTIDKNKSVVTINGTVYNNTATAFDSVVPMTICAFNMKSKVHAGIMSGKVYKCKIYDNDVLVRDFIPVMLKSTKEIGLWDKVNRMFYGNAGTGVFTSEKDTLLNMSWADIQTVCKAGKASEYWSVGDQKTITVNGTSYTVDLIGFDHDTPTDTSTYGRSKAGATFQLHDLLSTTYPMNSTATNSGGWKNSVMRTSTMATLLGQLNSDLKNVIVPVNKLSGTGGGSSSGTETTSDSLFLLSEVELCGINSFSVPGEGSQYEYYDSGNKEKNRDGSLDNWWERSPRSGVSDCFCAVSRIGLISYGTADFSTGVAFAFCV